MQGAGSSAGGGVLATNEALWRDAASRIRNAGVMSSPRAAEKRKLVAEGGEEAVRAASAARAKALARD
eukprot:1747364-Lingulodinium_polyedra.AAC.1